MSSSEGLGLVDFEERHSFLDPSGGALAFARLFAVAEILLCTFHEGHEPVDDFGVCFGEVVFFARVGLEIVKLEGAVFDLLTPSGKFFSLGEDQFPLPAADGLELGGVVIEEGFVR